MQSAIDVQSNFLAVSHSTTVGHLSHSTLDIRHAEATTFASRLEAHLQATRISRHR
jgi:hypothetical protein